MLDGAVYFDAVFVQFYNNYCGLGSYVAGSTTQNNFDFSTWNTWATTVSANPNVRVLLGVPGDTTAAGSGYEPLSTLEPIIEYCSQFSNFGGVMVWGKSAKPSIFSSETLLTLTLFTFRCVPGLCQFRLLGRYQEHAQQFIQPEQEDDSGHDMAEVELGASVREYLTFFFWSVALNGRRWRARSGRFICLVSCL
jgi:hypothetical protein